MNLFRATCFLTLFGLLTAFAQAPDTLWTRTYGNSYDNSLNEACLTTTGDICLIGSSATPTTGNDHYYLKVNAQGDTIWTAVRTWFPTTGEPELGNSVTALPNGDILFFGASERRGPGFYNDVTRIVRMSSAGTVLADGIVAENANPIDVYAAAVRPRTDGTFMCFGTFQGNNFVDWAVRTTNDGAVFSSQTPRMGIYVFDGIVMPNNSYIYVGGRNWGPLTNVSATYADANLAVQWDRQYGGSGSEYGADVALTPDGGFVVAGQTNSFGNGNQAFLLKLAANGDSLWMRMYGGAGSEAFGGVAVTPEGYILASGSTTTNSSGGYDGWVVMTESDGDTLWTKKIGGAADDYFADCVLTPSGSAVLTGTTRSYGAGGSDGWVLALSSVLPRSLALTSPLGGETWQIADTVNITWTSENVFDNINIEIDRNFPSGNWEMIGFNQPNTGSYSWRVSYPASPNCYLRIRTNGVSPIGDTTATAITIPPPAPENLPGIATNPFPSNGEINVANAPLLSWFLAPLALNYDIYVWPAEEAMPSTPTASHLVSNSYPVSPPLTYGHTYKWRLVARNYFGEVLGDEWSFTVGSLPDLVVGNITAPPTAFSGQSISVSWSVQNTGTGGTTTPAWSDWLYWSVLPTFEIQAATLLGTAQNASALAPGESYLLSASGTLPQGISGPYYVYVKTDNNSSVLESNESNNITRCVAAIDVELSPYADLRVTTIGAPTSTFSGTTAAVTWTVQNLGTGSTAPIQNWVEELYLSPDSAFGSDTYLGTISHSGALSVDSTYSGSANATIPQAIYGNYYLIVRSDAGGNIYEYVYENNNTTISNHIEVILSPPPDLVVTNVTAPSTANAGQYVTLSYTVQNQGIGSPFNPAWYDYLYISTLPTFQQNASIQIGGSARWTGLAPDSQYTVTTSNNLIPNGTSGDYYVYAITDATNACFEHNSEGNNITRSAAPITISQQPTPDLDVTSIQAPPTVVSGQPLTVNWTVQNNGTAATPASWSDRVWLMSGYQYNQDLSIASVIVTQNGPLAVGNNYTVSRTLQLPAVPAGPYTLWVVTDQTNAFYEYQGENDNAVQGPTITVEPYPPVDLVVTNVTAPLTGQSGQPAQLQWTIQNSGVATTVGGTWTDAVYLSVDATYNEGMDIFVGELVHNGTLAAGQSYSRTQTFTIPNGVAGSYYWIIRTDKTSLITEVNEGNNSSANAQASTISLTVPPDLTIESFDAPALSNAGQPITSEWLVRNIGLAAANGPVWYDALYLSPNVTLDVADTRLATFTRNGALTPSDTYPVTVQGDIPYYASGNYYLIAKADNSDAVYEYTGESNNIVTAPISIYLPPPADLVVSGIAMPDSAESGDNVSVTYTIENNSTNSAVGFMRDAVYFSLDTIWTIDDPLLGVQDRNINIAPGAVMTVSMPFNLERTLELLDVPVQHRLGRLDEGENGVITREMPGVVPANYYVIVRTDLRDNIREADNQNNSTASSSQINVDLPELELATPNTRSFAEGQMRFYRIQVGVDFDMRITLTSNQGTASNEIYVSYGEVPTLSNFDYSGAEPFSANQQFFVPSTQAGTYYVMVLARDASASENVTLLAEALPFSILDISPNVVGQGRVTTRIEGAGFRDSTMAFLRIAQDSLLPALSIDLENSTELRAIWNLESLPVGVYDVVLRNSTTVETEAPQAITVQPSEGLIYEFIQASPNRFRAGMAAEMSFVVTNTSNVNLPYFEMSGYFPKTADICGIQLDQWHHFQLPEPETLDQNYLSWDFQIGWDELTVIYAIKRDVAPGEQLEFHVTVCNASRWAYPVSITHGASTVDEYLDAQVEKTNRFRLRLLGGYTEADAETQASAAIAGQFVNDALDDYQTLSLIDEYDSPQDIPDYLPFIEVPDPLHLYIIPPEPDSLPPGCGPNFTADECRDRIRDLCDNLKRPICGGINGVASGLSNALLGSVAGIFCQSGEAWTCMSWHRSVEEVCQTFEKGCDPNDIIGPTGFGEEKWIAKTSAMPYTIRCENSAELATANASAVHITQQLDSDLNPNSFRLGSFGFANMTFEVPANRAYYTTRLDVRDSLGIYVDVTAGINVNTNEIFWNFTSIDPVTGQPPTSPFVGMLAINDSITHRGEGFVNYTIRPRTTSQTGDVIDAQASIVFDVNEPVVTPPIFNTIDADLPTSTVLPLPAEPDSVAFPVSWTGQDVVGSSGVANYALYVSEDFGPFSAYASNVEDTSIMFTGIPGHIYGFFSLATDNVGNVEAMKSAPEAVTFLQVALHDTITDVTIRANSVGDSVYSTLRWGSAVGNAYYYIYASDTDSEWNGGAGWSLLGTTTTSSYIDAHIRQEPDAVRFYRVLGFLVP